MKINAIRIYAEVLEQGLDFKEYIQATGHNGPVFNSYPKKSRNEFSANDSLIDRIRKAKDVDILISAISGECEYPLLMVEYSTAVPTDDHRMQRSDVYYWSAVFKCPMMKISPSTKGMGQDFGGGSKFTDEYEQIVSFRQGAVFYPIKWDGLDDFDVLPTKENACSCINYKDSILAILKALIATFEEVSSYEKYYKELRKKYSEDYSEILRSFSNEQLHQLIVNSTRFEWQGERLKVKINRFGHAMDPDRGILYFINMLVGTPNVITEIQVNRSANYDARGGYRSLFDALSPSELLKNYVQRIISRKHNVFCEDDALYVFKTALNISGLSIKKSASKRYYIEDAELYRFLSTHPTIVSKSIFMLSTELQLTDVNRDIICKVTWNEAPIVRYLSTVATMNYAVTPLSPLSINEAKEDIITYASVELYKKMHCDLLAVSYPGAQGDRCILTGSGRNVLRTYIDIIAYKDEKDSFKVFLQENKDYLSKSGEDVRKLNKIISDPESMAELENLFNKTVGKGSINNTFISIGAKFSPSFPRFDVDYLFMFDMDNTAEQNTKINYTVALVNTTLLPDFVPIMDKSRRLKGTLILEKLYIINMNAARDIVVGDNAVKYTIPDENQQMVAEDVITYGRK